MSAVKEKKIGIIENMKGRADLVQKIGDPDLNRKIVSLEGEVLALTREKRHLEVMAIIALMPTHLYVFFGKG